MDDKCLNSKGLFFLAALLLMSLTSSAQSLFTTQQDIDKLNMRTQISIDSLERCYASEKAKLEIEMHDSATVIEASIKNEYDLLQAKAEKFEQKFALKSCKIVNQFLFMEKMERVYIEFTEQYENDVYDLECRCEIRLSDVENDFERRAILLEEEYEVKVSKIEASYEKRISQF